MFTNSSFSKHLAGAVSLHPKPEPEETPALSSEGTKSPEAFTDEESKLLSASSSFAANIGPQPPVPQSIPPTSYRYGGGVAFPPTGPPGQGKGRGAGAKPVNRYRDSFSSNTSSAFTGNPPFSSGDVRRNDEDDALHMCRIISQRIGACTMWISRCPGIPPDRAARHREMLNEIGQLANSTVHKLRVERDQAVNEQRKQHDSYTRVVREKTAVVNNVQKLQRELGQALSKDDTLSKELKGVKARAGRLESENDTYKAKIKTLEDHYSTMVDKWSALEAEQRQMVQDYEDQIKELQGQNAQLAETGEEKPEKEDTPPPSTPVRQAKSSIDEDTYATLHRMLIEKHGSKPSDNDAAGPSGFKPNPTAPSWNPSSKAKQPQRLLKVPSSSSLNTRGGSPTGGPSNWPALISGGLKRGSSKAGSQKGVTLQQGSGKQVVGTFARHKQQWSMNDIQNGLDHIFGLTKGFIVKCHSRPGEPPKVADKMLEKREPTTWNYLLSLVYPNRGQAKNHMLYLLGVPAYRPYIIMRVVLDYLFKKVISPDIFLGIDPNLDSHLTALQEKITTYHHPNARANPRDRQRVIDEHARIVAHALEGGGVEQFKRESIERHSQMISIIMQPLRSMSVTEKEALASLQVMVSATWEVSSKVWMSGMTLHYTFPDCACKFAEGTMEPVNSVMLGLTAHELQMSQSRVSFVVSPVLSVRDERNEHELEYHGIKKAQVLVMK
ncbi:hypothetical protein F5Y11DRAFT_62729 [Daldinia sp. FL1419]|nr:hypothetical protein F5Y11DRAFT_62729 [Daldinia sp. FL1419]